MRKLFRSLTISCSPTSRVGQYPYNYITNFAKTSVDTNQTICNEVLGSGGLGTICQQFANMTILAPIFASIAK